MDKMDVGRNACVLLEPLFNGFFGFARFMLISKFYASLTIFLVFFLIDSYSRRSCWSIVVIASNYYTKEESKSMSEENQIDQRDKRKRQTDRSINRFLLSTDLNPIC